MQNELSKPTISKGVIYEYMTRLRNQVLLRVLMQTYALLQRPSVQKNKDQVCLDGLVRQPFHITCVYKIVSDMFMN